MTNHRTRLTLIDDDAYNDLQHGLARLRVSPDFRALIAILERELVIEREWFEEQPASEFQRGQVCMLKKVLNLINGE